MCLARASLSVSKTSSHTLIEYSVYQWSCRITTQGERGGEGEGRRERKRGEEGEGILKEKERDKHSVLYLSRPY